MASSSSSTPHRSRELSSLETDGHANTNPSATGAHRNTSAALASHARGVSPTSAGVVRSPLSRARKSPLHVIRSPGDISTSPHRSAFALLSPHRQQLSVPNSPSHVRPLTGSSASSPSQRRARCKSSGLCSTLLQDYIIRRDVQLFTRQINSATGGKRTRDLGKSRIASAEEHAFYAGEREKIARRLDECNREIAALEPTVEETYINIGTNQKSLHSALEEQQRMEAVVRDLSQREVTCLEERARIEEEYFSRLSAGLPFWPAEVRTAARHFVCIERSQHRCEEDYEGDHGQLRAYAQWLGKMGIRGPRRGIIPGEHCVAEEKINAMRTAFLGRG
eukprot:GEMP01020591.1.p1 GENE.GEMP01020591.1~~GEMP01020591.1.p1  ORF type:complete len:335 (+),score=92.98 GEMP01020591.1:128-1132(+)